MVELSVIASKKLIFVTLICYMFNVIYLHNRLSTFRKVTNKILRWNKIKFNSDSILTEIGPMHFPSDCFCTLFRDFILLVLLTSFMIHMLKEC